MSLLNQYTDTIIKQKTLTLLMLYRPFIHTLIILRNFFINLNSSLWFYVMVPHLNRGIGKI